MAMNVDMQIFATQELPFLDWELNGRSIDQKDLSGFTWPWPILLSPRAYD